MACLNLLTEYMVMSFILKSRIAIVNLFFLWVMGAYPCVIIAYPLFGFVNLCSFWFLFFHGSLARWNVPNIFTWNHNWVTWGIPRLILSRIQFPWGWETEPVCRNSLWIWCYRPRLSTTVWGMPSPSIIFDSTFSSCLWELACTWKSTEYYSSPLWERGLAALGIPFS